MRKAMIHELKTWPKIFEQMKSGLKTFDFRKNDRGFQVGDFLLLGRLFAATRIYSRAWLHWR
jgi:hypothetical protein